MYMLNYMLLHPKEGHNYYKVMVEGTCTYAVRDFKPQHAKKSSHSAYVNIRMHVEYNHIHTHPPLVGYPQN